MASRTASLQKPIAVSGDKAECLTEIFRDEVNLAVWNRSLQPAVIRFAEALSASAGQLERFISLSEGDSAAMVLPKWTLELTGADAWVADANEVIDMYRCLFEPEAVGLRLHVLQGAMCPRFHVDRVPVRLLCTYQSIGTEWLKEEQVNRPQGQGPLPDQSVDAFAVEPLATGAVGLLKGEAWEGNEGRGLVHRSPAPGDQPRLVMALDWL
ncbi:MAG: DUF1826 domain-containing protein [Marinobacter sp.]|uniref:DUF1826 domain-containing protein n=1 Tax=Marinobacter sp. TaxID=50741 RepID=UPI0034A00027